MLLLGPFGRGFGAGQVQPLSVTSLGLSVRSYKAISSWYLPILDLKVCGRCYATNLGCLPSVLPWAVQQKAEGTLRPAAAYWHLLAAHKAESLKEPWVVCKLGEVTGSL